MSFSLWTPVLSGAIFSSPSVAAFFFLVFLMLAAMWVGTLVTMVAITWDGCRRAQRWTSARLVLLLACLKVSKKFRFRCMQNGDKRVDFSRVRIRHPAHPGAPAVRPDPDAVVRPQDPGGADGRGQVSRHGKVGS